MPFATARQTTLIATLVASAATAQAAVGGSVSAQSDARERGLSYSDNRPSAQLSLAWDGDSGWFAGARLARASFTAQCCSAWLQSYGGRVFELTSGIDAEAGIVAHHYASIARYDFQEVYLGLLGERWNLRLYHARDYYGSGEASYYGELNLRWPVVQGLAAIAHVGLLYGRGGQPLPYVAPHGATRADLRIGASWQLGAGSELQITAVTAGSGGPTTWTDTRRRSTAVLSLTTAF